MDYQERFAKESIKNTTRYTRLGEWSEIVSSISIAKETSMKEIKITYLDNL
jgi:hypothetical protein